MEQQPQHFNKYIFKPLKSKEYSKLLLSKRNIPKPDSKMKNKHLSELSLSTAPSNSNKSKIESEPRGRKLKNGSFLSNQHNKSIDDPAQSNPNDSTDVPNTQEEVKNFLENCGLSMYYEKFIERGFDDMEILGDIEAGHLNGMGVKPGHQIKLKK